MQAEKSFYKILLILTAILLLSTTKVDAQLPTDSLAIYYPFNGNANDSSGNGYNATYIDASLTTDRFGHDSSAYSFNGISNTIQCGNILNEIFCAPIAKFSVVGWAKTRTSGSYEYGTGFILGKNAGGSYGPYQWNIAHVDGLLYGAVFSDTLAHNYIALTTPASTNQWYQFALVFDGTLPEMQRLKLYLNGVMSNTSVFQHVGTLGTTTIDSKQHLTIGASHEPNSPHLFNHFYDGTVDDIRIYAKPLTQVEINTLYHESGWDTTNHAPVANAGPDQTVFSDSLSYALVTLDGSASSDQDRDTLNYTWKQADTTLVTGVKPIIQLPLGSHTITLIVTDGKNSVDTDQVIINVKHLTEGLAAYYPFNGNANDESGNGFNGIVNGASLAADRFGNANSAYSFNGINNYIDLNDILDNVFCADTARFSISGWANIKSFSPYGGNLIIGKTAGGPGPYQWFLTYNNDGTLTGGVFSDSTVNNYQVKSTLVNKNQWFHFVLVFDGKQPVNDRIQIYVNNTLNIQTYSSAGTLGTSTTNTSLNLYIGGQNYFSSPQNLFNGLIDDIRIYAKPLTQVEINTLYHESGWDTTNHAPVANAGPDQTVFSDSLSYALVTLDGSASTDKDGDTLSYMWKQADTTLAIGVRPTIQLPLGSHTITLIVTDGKTGVDTDQVMINVKHLTNGLAAYYPFNGNANDESGNEYNAVYIDATLVADRFGNAASAYIFNGVNNTIQFGDILDNIFCTQVAKFSISVWASAISTGGLRPIISKSAGGLGPYQWTIGINNGYARGEIFSDTNTTNYIQLQKLITPNKWNHYVLVFDGSLQESSRVKFYVNGTTDNVTIYKKVGTIGTSTTNSQQQITVGATHNAGNPESITSPFYGIIDDIRIYAKALTKEEIDSLYFKGGWTFVEKELENLPVSFALSQNYPNPFNPSTTIRYELPMASRILIKVYNVIGQEVMVLKNGFEYAGYHEFTFENLSLPSGIYFYQMRAGSFIETKKMLLLK